MGVTSFTDVDVRIDYSIEGIKSFTHYSHVGDYIGQLWQHSHGYLWDDERYKDTSRRLVLVSQGNSSGILMQYSTGKALKKPTDHDWND